MNRIIGCAALLVSLATLASGQALTGADIRAIQGVLIGAANQVVEDVKDVAASAKAGAVVKETFARQRAAGHPPRADLAAVEAALRLQMRGNTGRLSFGRRWRAWPGDEAFRAQAQRVGEALEKHVEGLGSVRSWQCGYDEESSVVFRAAIGPLASSSPAVLDAQPPRPSYTDEERAYRFTSVSRVREPEPARDEASAAWADWAAAREADAVVEKMVTRRADAESRAGAKPLLRPDRAHLREALRLWRLASALENGGPVPPAPSAKRLDAAVEKIDAAVTGKYGRAPLKALMDCAFHQFVAEEIGRAAKRLLAAPR